MEQNSMNHYENQLYAVFKTFDINNEDSLDRRSLIDLCNALQLEEKGCQLIDSLLNAPTARATFTEFRDALLLLLGDENTRGEGHQSEEESSGREISPKYIHGSKKYGRRSRPPNNTSSEFQEDSDLDSSVEYNRVQRSVSNCDILSKKQRRNNNKLKRCTSFPGNQRHNESKEDNLPEFNTFQLDHTRIINYHEAVALCHRLHMEKVDTELLKQIFINSENQGEESNLTVGEFFHQLNKQLITSIPMDNNESVVGSAYCAEPTKDSIKIETIIEMWEQAGILQSQTMLYNLGFKTDNVELQQLMVALDEEIRMLISTMHKSAQPTSASMLLQASLCLHQYELKSIKNALEQVFAENNKLKTDLLEANQRAQLLAQEVDENHAKMEGTLRSQIKQLEVKHSEALKEMNSQSAKEKEQATFTISQLEEKLSNLEIEDSKLKTQFIILKDKNEELEKQLASCQEHISELEQVKSQLTKEVKTLANEKLHYDKTIKHESNETDLLVTEISRLREENKSLRDRNDELCTEIENLQEKLSGSRRRLSLTTKTSCDVDISGEQAESWSAEFDSDYTDSAPFDLLLDLRGGNAIKRRGDSPSKGSSRFEEESPRIGKVRKCHKMKQSTDPEVTLKAFLEEVKEVDTVLQKHTCNTSESGLECDFDSCSDASVTLEKGTIISTISTNQKLQNFANMLSNININEKIKASLLTMIKTYGIVTDHLQNVLSDKDVTCNSCSTLKQNLLSMKSFIDLDNTDIEILEKVSMCNVENKVVGERQNEALIDELKKELEAERLRHEEEKTKLTKMCKEMEANLEQLKMEYDNCEDYWAGKLDRECEIFAQEQRLSDEKFSNLLSKIEEYEEQYASTNKNTNASSSLATIEEKYSLEQQFTDLEDEFNDYKKKTNTELGEKDKEIFLLKEQLTHLEKTKVEVITDEHLDSINVNYVGKELEDSKRAKNNLDAGKRGEEVKVIECYESTSPINYLWNQSTIQSPITSKVGNIKRDTTRDYHNPAYVPTSDNRKSTDHSLFQSTSDNEHDRSTIGPTKTPGTPKRSCSAEILRSPNDSADSNGLNSSWKGVSAWGDVKKSPVSTSSMLQCADLEGHLRQNVQHPHSLQNEPSRTWNTANRNLEMACVMLEQKCQQLEASLRQHRAYMEAFQHSSRAENNYLRQKLFTAEQDVRKLQQRLASADLFVTELYVENCQNMARQSDQSIKPKLL